MGSRFSRSFNDQEVESVERFVLKLQAKRVYRDEEDRVIQTVSKSGKFSIISLYSVLEPSDPLLFPQSIIWSSCVPSKVAFFAWEATWGKALTLDHVQRRGFLWQIDVFFATLKKKPFDHILLHSAKRRIIWQLIFTLFGVSWVLPSLVKETPLGWHRSFLGEGRKKPWKVAPLCIFWTVWKERNMLAFDNAELTVQRMKNSFVCNLWS